jgi:APA family basic amino acid/polyamine antiporter
VLGVAFAVAHAAAPLADAVPALAPLVRPAAAVAALGSLLPSPSASPAPPSPWPATATSPPHWPICATPNSPSAQSWCSWPPRPTCAAPSASPLFGVLAYYAIANASAWTLRGNRAVPALGLVGCAVLAFALPPASVVAGAAVLAVGAGVYGARRAS